MSIALEIGVRHARVARVGADGVPRLVELAGSVPGEGLPLSAAASASYQEALRESYRQYRDRYGPAERVVAVVPPHALAEHARAAGEVFPPTGSGPGLRVLAAPVAVLALLRQHGTLAAGRYLVCDLGARSAELSLCAVSGQSVALESVQRAAPPEGLGDGFDAALLAGAGLSATAPAARDALAAARSGDGVGRRLDLAVEHAARPGKEVYGTVQVLTVLDREVTAGGVLASWRPVAAVLGRLAGGMPHGPAVVAVGGLARLSLAGRFLAAGRQAADLPEEVDPALAAVLGGALVAAGAVDPGDRYPNAVYVLAHGAVAGELSSRELLVAAPNTLEPGGPTVFSEPGGQRVRVRTDPDGRRPVQIGVRAEGGAGAQVLALPLPPSAPGARWHVGVRLTVEGTALLVLRSPDASQSTEYPLGVLPNDPEGVPS